MQFRLVLALLIIVGVYWLMAKYRRLPANKRKQWLFKVGVGTAIALVLLAVVAGRVHWLGGVAAALVGFAKFGVTRLLPLMRIVNGLGGNLKNTPFGNPVFSTPFLRVQLNLHMKSMTGEVIEGPHKGASLAQLTPSELTELEVHYEQKDARSYYLIRAFRQTFNQNKSQQPPPYNPPSVGEPTYQEALLILGLDSFSEQNLPDKKTVTLAHRRLMQKIHPDRGGNDYLASRVNIAKEVVLKTLAKE
ncbi:J domain-containing protein [Teredinibacter purpureus]|uniref:hypothetical protein n=1 Tax=Teredinibacter purpureus TaxID=2731756 RepID=UPI0005F7BD0C|nr:hypothetical protein [Teredinibacter purpureus]